MRYFLCSFLLMAAGCGATKTPPQDQFAEPGKADAFSSKMKIVGDLAYNDPAITVRYNSSPRYRAVTFDGGTGDPVDVWVRSTQGDAVAWLLDASYRVVAKNDDADATTYDAHMTAKLPRDGTFYIVLRDYNWESHNFTVQLGGPTGGCGIKLQSGGSNSTVDGYDKALSDGGAGWQLYTRTLPSCVDFTDPAARDKLRETLRSGGILDGGSKVTVTPMAMGGTAFVQQLDASLMALHAKRGPDAHADSLEAAIKRPVLSTPDAFLEVKLAYPDGRCSESGAALTDTRTGIVYVVAQLNPC